ncbi:hypothetical protein [Clostridium tyrobutyricum]|uniref:hypothetical protein n=1 Tax=Clostridium tyrobutyricum TaxID=1519 RepID=UPI001C3D91C3|nr:hypothetical protein [Clostridium tyrobutyricum]MBV4438605.1 hypothetical protein [Clostridium tyrobutyricum]
MINIIETATWVLSLSNPNLRTLISSGSSFGTKEWILEEQDFPKGTGYLKKSGSSYKCSLEKLLLATGVAMTNADSPNSYESWYAILKHINTFTADKMLFAEESFKDLDFHKKTISADKIGMGACLCLMGDIYGIKFAADADYFMKKTINNTSSPYYRYSLKSVGKYRKNGNQKPDFFCISDSREGVVVEAKGTFGPYSNLKNPLNKGKNQVQNVTLIGIKMRPNASRLVMATQIPIYNVNTKSWPHTIIKDPEENNLIKVNVTEEEIARLSLAKTFCFMGLYDVADDFLNFKSIGYWIEEIESMRYQYTDSKYYIVNSDLYGNYFAYMPQIFEAIRISEKDSLVKGLIETGFYESESMQETETEIFLSNGFGVLRNS